MKTPLKLTIFTPTYNRGYIIENLYRSLQRQPTFDFEWLVINDGSTDQTDELFTQWMQEENPFTIRYYKQQNQGLMVAFNRGVQLANGTFLAKIDSDDYITDDCIAFFLKGIENIKDNYDVYAVGGMRGTKAGVPLKGCNRWPKINPDTGFLDLFDYERANYNLDAEMTEAWKIDLLKQFPFPEFPGEFFAPEEIVFNTIALKGYKIRWFAKIICVCEYREDGLTKNDLALQKNNPLGFSMMWKYKSRLKIPLQDKIYCLIQAGALALYGGGISQIWTDTRYQFLSTILLPFSFIVFLRRRKQFKAVK